MAVEALRYSVKASQPRPVPVRYACGCEGVQLRPPSRGRARKKPLAVAGRCPSCEAAASGSTHQQASAAAGLPALDGEGALRLRAETARGTLLASAAGILARWRRCLDTYAAAGRRHAAGEANYQAACERLQALEQIRSARCWIALSKQGAECLILDSPRHSERAFSAGCAS